MTFNRNLLLQKLKSLTMAENSIQGLSLWMIHHKRDAVAQAEVWTQRVAGVDANKGLALFYLANEVIQNSRRKRQGAGPGERNPPLVAPEMLAAFKQVLPKAIRNFVERAGDAGILKVRRIVGIWEERAIYRHDFIETLYRALGPKGQGSNTAKRTQSSSASKSTSKRRATDRGIVSQDGDDGDDSSSTDGDMDIDPLPLDSVAKILTTAHDRSIEIQEQTLLMSLATRTDTFNEEKLGECLDTAQVRSLTGEASRTISELEKLDNTLSEESAFRKSLLQTLTRCLGDQKRRISAIKKEKEMLKLRTSTGNAFVAKSNARAAELPAPAPLPTLPKSLDLFGGAP